MIKKHSLFFTFILSYISILLLPVTLVGLLFYTHFFSVLEKEIIQNNETIVKNIHNTFDTKINELNKIAYQIFYNQDLGTSTLTKGPIEASKSLNILHNYIFTNQMIYDIALFESYTNTFYGSTSTFNTNQYFNQRYIFDNWSLDAFLSELNTEQHPYFKPINRVLVNNNQYKNFLVYIFPNPSKSSISKRSLVYLIDVQLLRNTLTFKDEIVIILDRHNQPLMYLGPEDDSSSNAINYELIDIKSSGSFIHKLDGSKYFVSSINSSTTGLTYISMLPVNVAMRDLISIKNMFVFTILVVLLVGVLIIAVMLKLNYNPIKHLKTFAENASGQSFQTVNDLEAIKMAVSHMSEASKEMSKKVKSNRSALKDYLLLNLFKGYYKDIEEFNKNAQETNMKITKQHHRIIVIAMDIKTEYYNMESLTTNLEDYLQDGDIQGYGRPSINEKRLIFVLSYDFVDKDMLSDKLRDMQKHLLNATGMNATLGVGNQYKNLDKVGKSFIEANTSIDYQLIKGKYSIIFYEDIISQSAQLSYYPKKELKELEFAIMSRDIDKISEILLSILAFIKKDVPLAVAKCLCFDIINTILKNTYDMQIYEDSQNKQRRYPDVMKLIEFETIEELGLIVKRISLDICCLTKNSKDDRGNLMGNILSYIHKNFDQYDFTIQSMADNFVMSLSNISQYFKAETNQTLSQYVNGLRMDKAKELLGNTDKSIQEITMEVGYTDMSSFIRKFKLGVGTTPGNYRKIYKKAEKFPPTGTKGT